MDPHGYEQGEYRYLLHTFRYEPGHRIPYGGLVELVEGIGHVGIPYLAQTVRIHGDDRPVAAAHVAGPVAYYEDPVVLPASRLRYPVAQDVEQDARHTEGRGHGDPDLPAVHDGLAVAADGYAHLPGDELVCEPSLCDVVGDGEDLVDAVGGHPAQCVLYGGLAHPEVREIDPVPPTGLQPCQLSAEDLLQVALARAVAYQQYSFGHVTPDTICTYMP